VHDLPGRPCSAAAALDVVGEKWALLAIREILAGNRRFNEIARNTGAPRDRLAARLGALVEAGVLQRREYQTRPSRSEYYLTAAGRDLAPVIRALLAWGDRWVSPTPPVTLMHGDHELDEEPVCRTCGEPVREREVRVRSNAPGWDQRGRKTDT
jgi:DNA-binding HxlR family transcriptional regulator